MNHEFEVWFTNVTGCAVGSSAISWSATVSAESEEKAVELALEQARLLNRGAGLPPHGLRVSDAYLQSLASATLKKRGEHGEGSPPSGEFDESVR